MERKLWYIFMLIISLWQRVLVHQKLIDTPKSACEHQRYNTQPSSKALTFFVLRHLICLKMIILMKEKMHRSSHYLFRTFKVFLIFTFCKSFSHISFLNFKFKTFVWKGGTQLEMQFVKIWFLAFVCGQLSGVFLKNSSNKYKWKETVCKNVRTNCQSLKQWQFAFFPVSKRKV